MNDTLIPMLIEAIRDCTKQSATTAQAVIDLTARFNDFEKRVFGKEGLSDDVDEMQGKMSYAKGYLAAWASIVGIGSSAATLALHSLFKKLGWVS